MEQEDTRVILYKTGDRCPCCGQPIMAGQEACLYCRVYLWEVDA